MSSIFQTYLYFNTLQSTMTYTQQKGKKLTNAPFISLKTTPLKTKAVWGSLGFSCSSRHPSCLKSDE